MVRFLKRIKQCEINEKIKSKSELQIDINQKYIFTAEGKNQIIFFIWAFVVRYAHLPSFLLLTKGFAFCYAKTRKLAMSGFSGFLPILFTKS